MMLFLKMTEEDSYVGFYKLHFLWVGVTGRQKTMCSCTYILGLRVFKLFVPVNNVHGLIHFCHFSLHNMLRLVKNDGELQY